MLEYTTMIQKLGQHIIVRYVISGGTAAVVDLALLYFFHTVCGVHYLFAAILAYAGAFCVSFTLQKFWTFRNNSREDMHRQLVLYLGLQLLGLSLNTLFMYIFVDLFHIQVILAQIFAGAIVAFFTFFISRHFIFKSEKIPENI